MKTTFVFKKNIYNRGRAKGWNGIGPNSAQAVVVVDVCFLLNQYVRIEKFRLLFEKDMKENVRWWLAATSEGVKVSQSLVQEWDEDGAPDGQAGRW